MNQETPIAQQGLPSYAFYIAACLVTFVRDEDEGPKQKHMNVLMQTDSANVTKHDLNMLNRMVMQRMNIEAGVTPDQIKDCIFLNITMLGIMTEQEFHGKDYQDPATVDPDGGAEEKTPA